MRRSEPDGSCESAARTITPCEIEQVARMRLASAAHYAHCFRQIAIQHSDGVLTLRGRLPTFYLKQVLQTLLRDLEGVERIDNRVEVTNSTPHPHFSHADGNGVLPGLGRIRNAWELLNDHATPLAKRLLDAAMEFLAATRFDQQWPTELRRTANLIKSRLLSTGDVPSSIRAMDEAALDETATQLLRFARAARRSTPASG